MRLRTVMAPFFLALLFVATGCNGSSDSDGSAEPLAVDVQTLDANGMSSDDFASGQQITFTMTAQNMSAQPQTFNIQPCFGAAAYAVFKQGTTDMVGGGRMADGVECHSLIQGGAATTLAPGQSVKASITWPQGTTGDQLMPPGSYSVMAGIACVQANTCMPVSGSGTDMLPIGDSTIYRSAAINFTINP